MDAIERAEWTEGVNDTMSEGKRTDWAVPHQQQAVKGEESEESFSPLLAFHPLQQQPPIVLRVGTQLRVTQVCYQHEGKSRN